MHSSSPLLSSTSTVSGDSAPSNVSKAERIFASRLVPCHGSADSWRPPKPASAAWRQSWIAQASIRVMVNSRVFISNLPRPEHGCHPRRWHLDRTPPSKLSHHPIRQAFPERATAAGEAFRIPASSFIYDFCVGEYRFGFTQGQGAAFREVSSGGGRPRPRVVMR